MNAFWLIYHPKREKTIIESNLTVYHDSFSGNQDPYIWSERFLHSYCHITQMRNEEGQINFWISGDAFPNFTKLYCDCVFVIDEKKFWEKNNCIRISDKIVDNEQAFKNHYNWANKGQHYFKRRRRYTLKANSEKSFQPQDKDNNLIDILPFLNQNGVSTELLINSMKTNYGSRPFKLKDDLGQKLYNYLSTIAIIKLFGRDLMHRYPNRPIED